MYRVFGGHVSRFRVRKKCLVEKCHSWAEMKRAHTKLSQVKTVGTVDHVENSNNEDQLEGF